MMFYSSFNKTFRSPNMVPKWSQNGYKHPENSWTFRATLPRRFQNVSRTAFETYTIFKRFEIDFGAVLASHGNQVGTKWLQKSIPKTIKKLITFCIDFWTTFARFWTQLGCVWPPKMHQIPSENRSQEPSKFESNS